MKETRKEDTNQFALYPDGFPPCAMASLSSCCNFNPSPSLLRSRPRIPAPHFLSNSSFSSSRSALTVGENKAACLASAKKNDSEAIPARDKKNSSSNAKEEQKEEFVEVEEELPWIQEKALDIVEFTGSVTQAIPGPRVGQSSLPWILAVPLAYASLTFVIAFVKTVRKFSSPREKRRRMVNKNAMLCKSIDELLEKGTEEVKPEALDGLVEKTGFGMEEILRKYIRYALNEKPFNPDLVSSLILLRRAAKLADSQVADILNQISRRIVQDKGPVVMDMSGYSEKGFKRKLAVQTLFGKVYYLSDLPEFCSRDSSLIVKEIFGVTDDDAEKLRIHTLTEAGDVDYLEKMADDSEDLGGSNESSSRTS